MRLFRDDRCIDNDYDNVLCLTKCKWDSLETDRCIDNDYDNVLCLTKCKWDSLETDRCIDNDYDNVLCLTKCKWFIANLEKFSLDITIFHERLNLCNALLKRRYQMNAHNIFLE